MDAFDGAERAGGRRGRCRAGSYVLKIPQEEPVPGRKTARM